MNVGILPKFQFRSKSDVHNVGSRGKWIGSRLELTKKTGNFFYKKTLMQGLRSLAELQLDGLSIKVKEFINDRFVLFAFIGDIKCPIVVKTEAFGLGVYFLFQFFQMHNFTLRA